MKLTVLALVVLTTVNPPVVLGAVNYRCNCGDFGVYYDPLFILRQALGKFRSCWAPLDLRLKTLWRNEKYPDTFEFSTTFQCQNNKHFINFSLDNSKGAIVWDERFYYLPILEQIDNELILNERLFPWYQAPTYFNCGNIQEGENVDYVNPGRVNFPPLYYIDRCYKQTPIDVFVEVSTSSEKSTCTSQSWWYNEYDVIRSVHFLEFCKTPRILSVEVQHGSQNNEERWFSSSLEATYECDYGDQYTFKIEHWKSSIASEDLECAANKDDVSLLFEKFTFVPGVTTCSELYTLFTNHIG